MALPNPSKNSGDITQQQAAIIAGIGLLFMFISGLLISGPQVTLNLDELTDLSSSLRKNMIGDVLMLVFDVVAALGLYVFLKPVNKSLSLMSAWFRLMHVAIYGSVLVNLLLIVYLYEMPSELSVMSTEAIKTHSMLFLNVYENGLMTGLVFFGLHFLILGYLIVKSEYIPRILGILLLISAVGYLINSFAAFLLPNYADYKITMQQIIFLTAMVAELSLCLWLLIKGSRITNPSFTDQN